MALFPSTSFGSLMPSPSSFGSLMPSPSSFGRFTHSAAAQQSNQMTQDFMRRREEEIARQQAEKQAQEEQARQAAMAQQQAALPQQPIQPGFNQFGQPEQLPGWAQQFNQQFQMPQQMGFGQQMPNFGMFGQMPSLAIQPNQQQAMQNPELLRNTINQQPQQSTPYYGTNFQAPSGFGQAGRGYFF